MEENNNAWPLMDINYPSTAQESCSIIKVVGVGGGGSNAVTNMYMEGIQDVTYLIINTDEKALNASPVPQKLLISDDGLGAGADPDLAQEYAIEFEESIQAALNDGTKMVFITAGMGGGTGTGAAPEVARIAYNMGILTIGIVTIPFDFEGVPKIQMALKGVSRMRQHVDALLVVNNNRLPQIYPDLNFFNAFKKADDTLTISAKSIADIINITGYINLDFKDVRRTLKDSGVALISTGQASGENRLSEAIKNAVYSPLLQDNEISHAQRLLFEVCFSSTNPITMSEINELNEFVRGMGPDIKVIWGALVDETLGDDVRIIVLAAGFDLDSATGKVTSNAFHHIPATETDKEESVPAPAAQPEAPAVEPASPSAVAATPVSQPGTVVVEAPANAEPQSAPAPVTEAPVSQPAPPVVPPAATVAQPAQVDSTTPTTPDEPSVAATPSAPDSSSTSEATTASQEAASAQSTVSAPVIDHPTSDPMQSIEEIRKYYGEEMADSMRMDQIRKNYYLLDNDDLTNEQLVSMLERMPAYNRTIEQLGELKKVSAKSNEPAPPPAPNNGNIF